MRQTNRGFTLTELLVVIAILAILAWVAVPSYFSYLEGSRRSEAHVGLLALAQAQEQFYAVNNTYTNDITNNLLALVADQTSISGAGNYTFSVTAADATTFTLSADPQNAQAGDTGCDPITLNGAGARLPADCW